LTSPQAIRTEVYNAIQGAMNDYDLLITPTMASLPVDTADDDNILGPTEINGEEVDPLPFPVVVTQDRFSWHFP
jgi:amidase